MLPKVLTPQHRIRTRVLLVESPKLYPPSHRALQWDRMGLFFYVNVAVVFFLTRDKFLNSTVETIKNDQYYIMYVPFTHLTARAQAIHLKNVKKQKKTFLSIYLRVCVWPGCFCWRFAGNFFR